MSSADRDGRGLQMLQDMHTCLGMELATLLRDLETQLDEMLDKPPACP